MNLRFIPLGVLCASIGFALVSPSTAFAAEPTTLAGQNGALNLEEALRRTLGRSPDLAVATEDLRAAEAEAAVAGRLPNPELTVSLENVAGSGLYNSTEAAELTVEVSQPIELGGKRRLRREAAELVRQMAAYSQKLAHADVLATTRQRFIAALAAQEQLALAEEQAVLAAKSLTAADARIDAGEAPAIDRLRLQGEASRAKLAVAHAERTLAAARQALAGGWGDEQPDFDRVDGDLSVLPTVPPLDEVDAALEQAAAVLSRRINTALSNIELAQAKAHRLPDPSLTVGWRQFKESDDNALLFGLSVPLPLFNQGREAVAAASSRYNSAKARELSDRNQARSTLRGAWQALADARAAAEVLASQVVPAAAEGFVAAEFGYGAGEFGLIELLDAQRTLFEAKQQQLTARIDCHLAAIELQRLRGVEAMAAPPQLQIP